MLIPSLMDLGDAFNNGSMTLDKLVGNMQARAVLAHAVHTASACNPPGGHKKTQT